MLLISGAAVRAEPQPIPAESLGFFESPPPTRSWIDRRNFRGRIDEVMIFDHALSDQEIADLHAAGRP